MKKKSFISGMGMIMTILFIFAMQSLSLAVISGSKHDFSSGDLDSCYFCHTPHNGNVTDRTLPLWNRETPEVVYDLYGGGQTLNETTINQPGPHSLSCLSCHDGTIAIDDLVNYGTGAGSWFLDAGSAAFGTDLAGQHPIGFEYDENAGAAGVEGELPEVFKLYGENKTLFECATCHDPHETSHEDFLRMGKNGICSACHVNK